MLCFVLFVGVVLLVVCCFVCFVGFPLFVRLCFGVVVVCVLLFCLGCLLFV